MGDTAAEPVFVGCYSCRTGTTQAAERRPDGGWMYDPLHGWRCPSCSEAIIEALRSEVADHQRQMSAATWLTRAVKAHMPFWQRVNWQSERCEKDVVAAIEAFELATREVGRG